MRVLCLLAAGFIALTFFLPLWSLRLEARQYETEGPLRVEVYMTRVVGDLFELNVLNEYIGAHFPATVPETAIFPLLLGLAAFLLFLAGAVSSSRGRTLLKISAVLLLLVVVLGPLSLQVRLYQFGHHRDPNPPLAGIPNFTVPLLGPSRFANWTLHSRFRTGALTLGLAAGLAGLALWCSKRLLPEGGKDGQKKCL